MNDYARITVVGSRRRSDLAVPGDEAVAGFLPGLLDLLGEAPGPVTRPPVLVRCTGEQLDPDRTLADHGLREGELLRLIRADEAPPAPEVADVTDILGESLSHRPGLWSGDARRLTGAIALGLLGVIAGALLPPRLGYQASPSVVVPVMVAPFIVAGVLVLAAAVLGRAGATWGALTAMGVAWGLCLPAVIRIGLPEHSTATGWVLPVVTALGLCGWICVGSVVGFGLRRPPALAGSLVGLLTTGVPVVVSSSGPVRAAAIAATAAVVVCGLLPRYAAGAGGLTRMDDRMVAGELRRRDDVQRTIDRAYASLTWSTAGVAIAVIGPVGLLLVSADPWALGLGLAVTAVTALRTRGFPLAAQQVALWGAVAAAVAQGLIGRPWPSASALGAAVVVLALAVTAAVLVRPPGHVRALLRKAGNGLELIAVLAMVPLLLGLFGVYADLLRVFS